MTPARTGTDRRILLLTDALGGMSAPVGTAILRRLLLMNPRPIVTVMDFFDEFIPGVAVLAKLAYTQDPDFMPACCGEYASASAASADSPILGALGTGGIERLEAVIREGRYDAVVSTSSVAAAAAGEIPATSRPLLVSVLSAFSARGQWIHPSCDLYFVATKEIREDLVMAGIPYSRIVVSGLPASFDGVSKSRAELRSEAGIADRFTVVMGDAGQTHADVKQIASSLVSNGIQVVAVPSRDKRVAQQLRSLSASSGMLKLIDSREQFAGGIGDVVLARAGGAILLEAVCAGVPSVIYTGVAAQERVNVDFLLNAGVSLLGRDDDDVVDKVRYLSSHPERLAQMTASAARMGRNDAARIVVDRLTAVIR